MLRDWIRFQIRQKDSTEQRQEKVGTASPPWENFLTQMDPSRQQRAAETPLRTGLVAPIPPLTAPHSFPLSCSSAQPPHYFEGSPRCSGRISTAALHTQAMKLSYRWGWRCSPPQIWKSESLTPQSQFLFEKLTLTSLAQSGQFPRAIT